MTANADVLLYGCDIAAGDSGTALVNELHVLTNENIAASTDTTGSSDLGGNWVLEAKSSTVRTASAFSDSAGVNHDPDEDLPKTYFFGNSSAIFDGLLDYWGSNFPRTS